MKVYTIPDQTAKLIELGFEKPKSEVKAEQAGGSAWYNPAYSIGELIEMLPKEFWETAAPKKLTISFDYLKLGWVIKYRNSKFSQFSIELIDALYDMILRLKEERVI